MINRYRIILVCMFLLIATSVLAGDVRLSGKWILTYYPDGPVQEDWMIFRESGDAYLGSQSGVYLTCPYKIDGNNVILTCSIKEKTKSLIMHAQDGYTKLMNPSGAIYSKQ